MFNILNKKVKAPAKFIEVRNTYGIPGNIVSLENDGYIVIPNVEGCIWLILDKPISLDKAFSIYTKLFYEEYLRTKKTEWDLGKKDGVQCTVVINKKYSFDIKLKGISS